MEILIFMLLASIVPVMAITLRNLGERKLLEKYNSK
jgi:hypothetical protein